MEDKLIIDLWKKGFTVQQVSKQYMEKFNKTLKTGQKRINELQAQQHIEPIIFKYQTSMMR